MFCQMSLTKNKLCYNIKGLSTQIRTKYKGELKDESRKNKGQ
jgi:hypothetical protein